MTYLLIGLLLAIVWAFVFGLFGRKLVKLYILDEDERLQCAYIGSVLLIFLWPFCLIIGIVFGAFALGHRLARK